MAVFRLFRNKPFEPEAITMMSGAYADVCDALGVNQRDLPAMDTVAKTVIEFAQRGVNDRSRLRERVLEQLTPN
jgi:hypothetical protein